MSEKQITLDLPDLLQLISTAQYMVRKCGDVFPTIGAAAESLFNELYEKGQNEKDRGNQI